MGKYKLSREAEADLIRIHQWGCREFGEAQADEYYFAFFEHFEQLASQPYLYPEVDDVREGYRRGVCGVDSFTTELPGTLLKSWPYLEIRIRSGAFFSP